VLVSAGILTAAEGETAQAAAARSLCGT
jgi:hypothetical protein